MSNHQIMPICEVCGTRKNAAAPIPIESKTANIYGLFLSEATLQDHEKKFLEDKNEYIKKLEILLERSVSISSASKIRACTVLYAHKLHDSADKILEKMSPAEILGMIKLLDNPRKVRSLKRKLDLLQERAKRSAALTSRPPNQSVQRLKGKTKKKLEMAITTAEKESLTTGGLTNAINRKIRKWLQAIPPEKLEFYLVNFPKEPWKQISDLCHCGPTDFTLEYFLAAVYGAELPADCLVSELEHSNLENISSLLDKYPNLYTFYSYLRKKFPTNLSPELRGKLARHAPLEDILWWYEDLHDPSVESIIFERLEAGETIQASGRERGDYGKLMERLLTFRAMKLKFVPQLIAYAEQKLNQIGVFAESRVVVMGDASGSMEVAIQVATIIGSLVTVCLKAELLFFNDKILYPSYVPSTAADVLCITEEIKAERSTSPAIALYKYYKMKQPVDLFIVVTDEEENTPCNGMMFADLFKKYCEEVNQHAQIFLVSFLSGPTSFLGKMRASLRSKGIGCRQFRFDLKRPDLSKLSHLIGMLSLECAYKDGNFPSRMPEEKTKEEVKENTKLPVHTDVGSEPLQGLLSKLSEEEKSFIHEHPDKLVNLIKTMANIDEEKKDPEHLPPAPMSLDSQPPSIPVPEKDKQAGNDDGDCPS